MNPRPKDQFSGTNVLVSIMNKVSAAIEKRYETPTTILHKQWNAVVEDKRKQKKERQRVNRLNKNWKAESDAIKDNMIQRMNNLYNPQTEAENEIDKN